MNCGKRILVVYLHGTNSDKEARFQFGIVLFPCLQGCPPVLAGFCEVGMKIKRVQILRPDIDVEYTKSALGRLHLLYCLRMFLVKKVHITFYVCGLKLSKPISVYYISIPKFHFIGKEI